MFHMFDRLLLLCKGQTAYFGDVDKVLGFFQDIGLEMKANYNPADFICKYFDKKYHIFRKYNCFCTASQWNKSNQRPRSVRKSLLQHVAPANRPPTRPS